MMNPPKDSRPVSLPTHRQYVNGSPYWGTPRSIAPLERSSNAK